MTLSSRASLCPFCGQVPLPLFTSVQIELHQPPNMVCCRTPACPLGSIIIPMQAWEAVAKLVEETNERWEAQEKFLRECPGSPETSIVESHRAPWNGYPIQTFPWRQNTKHWKEDGPGHRAGEEVQEMWNGLPVHTLSTRT